MKQVVIADVHGHDTWKKIVEIENPDEVIFLGDYFDSFSVSQKDQINNFVDILSYRIKSELEGRKVVLLIGNHDHHYFKEVGYTGTSGYTKERAYAIGALLGAANKTGLLQMAYKSGDFLFSHAGIGGEWLKKMNYDYNEGIDEFINRLWKDNPKYAFEFDGTNGYGDDIGQTPIWIRPRSLTADPLKFMCTQIVGHTTQDHIKLVQNERGNYYFVDTLPYEYLVIEDGKEQIQIL